MLVIAHKMCSIYASFKAKQSLSSEPTQRTKPLAKVAPKCVNKILLYLSKIKFLDTINHL